MTYATTDFIKLPGEDGEMIFVNALVQHVDDNRLKGRIRDIRVPYKGSGVCRFLIDIDEGDADAWFAAARLGDCWPTGPNEDYIQVRDTGLPAWKWETVK